MHKVFSIDANQIFTCVPVAFVSISCVRLSFVFVEWTTEFGGYKTFVVKNEDEEVCISIFCVRHNFSLIYSFSHWSQLLIHYSWFIKMIQTHLVSQSTLM